MVTNDKIKELNVQIVALNAERDEEVNKIISCSTYNTEVICGIMLQLISTFEGEKFTVRERHNKMNFSCKKSTYFDIVNPNRSDAYSDFRFTIEGKNYGECLLVPDKYIFKNNVKLDDIPNHVKEIRRRRERDAARVLLPSEMEMTDVSYIEEFLEELFQYRVDNYSKTKSAEISKEQLVKFLEDYLFKKQEQIQARRIGRKQYIDKQIELYKLRQYQDTCMIETESFVDAISTLINSMDSPYRVECTLEYDCSNFDSIRVELYRNIQIIGENDDYFEAFKVLKGIGINDVGDFETAKKEADNDNEDKFIKFYDLHFPLFRFKVAKKIPFLKLFFEELETIYQTKNIITAEDINDILNSKIKHRTRCLTKKDTTQS